MAENTGIVGQVPERFEATARGNIPETTLVDATGMPLHTPAAQKGIIQTAASSPGPATVTLASIVGLTPEKVLLLSSAGLTAPVLNTPAFSATGGSLAAGSTYGYRVTALSAYGETLPSAEATVSIPAGLVPPTISSLATLTSGGTIGAGVVLAYRVTAVDAVGESLPGPEATVTTTPPLAAPTMPNGNHPVLYGHAQPNGFRPAQNVYYKVTALNALGETTASAEYTATTPGIGYVAATTTAIGATGSQSFTLTATTGVLTSISNGDTLQFDTGGNLELVALTAWNSGTGVGTATFTKTHLANVVVNNAVYSVSFFWNNVTGATSYNIYHSTVSGSEGLAANRTDGNAGYFDGNGSTGAAPPGANTTAGTANQAVVSWLAVPGAVTYTVYGRTASAEQKLATGISGLTWTDTGSVTPSGALPVTDSTQASTNSVSLSWPAVTGATGGYKVYGRMQGAEALLASVAPGTTSYTDTGGATPAGLLPVVDASMVPPEQQTVASSFVNTGGTNVAVPLTGSPDASRTLAQYDIAVPAGPGTGPFLDYNLIPTPGVVLDPITGLVALLRAATQDGVSGRHLQEIVPGLLNALGGFDRQKGSNGAALIVDGCVPGLPVLHRSNVQAQDGSYPTSPTATATSYPHGAIIPTQGQRYVDLDVTLTNPAGGAATATLTPLFWNPRQSVWVAQATQTVTLASGTSTVQGFRLDTRGRTVFIAVGQLSAGCFVSIDGVLS